MKYLLIFWLAPLLISTATAGPPKYGTYSSYGYPDDSIFSGRFSESWIGAGTTWQLGNTLNCNSWDGAVLANEWAFLCPHLISEPFLVSDGRDENGTGDVIWKLIYGDGSLRLAADGPWGDGTTEYLASANAVQLIIFRHYLFGNLVAERSHLTVYGWFDGWNRFLEMEIGFVEPIGNSDVEGAIPSDFPEFMDQNCQTGIWSRGMWGMLNEIEIRIVKPLAVEPSTWGKIKLLYSD